MIANELGIYSIQDIKTCYIGLTTGASDDDAVRSFAFAIKQNGLWRENASDYRVVRLGTFDIETGVITPMSSPRVLAEGGQLVPVIRKEIEDEDNK